VAEVNNGGDMVESNIRTVRAQVPYKKIHATRGKQVRAQPVASLYEQGVITHCDIFEELEEQLTTWTPESGTSPDRLDALVWALTELFVKPRPKPEAV
jgi:phage terminase large subunit-like protein